MTYEKAIDLLDTLLGMIEDNQGNDYDEALKIGIMAIKKQIPMKLRYTTSTKRCWNCNKMLASINSSHINEQYCKYCGQMIKWGVMEMTYGEAMKEIIDFMNDEYGCATLSRGSLRMAIGALNKAEKQAISDKASDKVNKILDELKWKLLSRLSHLEIENHNPIELHETIEDIVVDEIDKIKISTI